VTWPGAENWPRRRRPGNPNCVVKPPHSEPVAPPASIVSSTRPHPSDVRHSSSRRAAMHRHRSSAPSREQWHDVSRRPTQQRVRRRAPLVRRVHARRHHSRRRRPRPRHPRGPVPEPMLRRTSPSVSRVVRGNPCSQPRVGRPHEVIDKAHRSVTPPTVRLTPPSAISCRVRSPLVRRPSRRHFFAPFQMAHRHALQLPRTIDPCKTSDHGAATTAPTQWDTPWHRLPARIRARALRLESPTVLQPRHDRQPSGGR